MGVVIELLDLIVDRLVDIVQYVVRDLDGYITDGLRVYADTWARREVFDESSPVYPGVLAAGIEVVAYIGLLEEHDEGVEKLLEDVSEETNIKPDAEAILSTVEPHRETVGMAPEVVFVYLHDGTNDVTPAQLRSMAKLSAGGESDDEDPSLGVVTTLEFAKLLDALVE